MAQRLHAGAMTQRELCIYYLVAICGVYAMYTFLACFFSLSTIMLFSFLGIAFACIAVPYCYSINRAPDNKQFIERMVCLGFVATVHILVVCLAVGGALCMSQRIVSYELPWHIAFALQALAICCIHAYFYYVVARGLRQ
jgi:hypothetical protein